MYNWEVVDSLFKERPLVQQHIDSYNEFIKTKIHTAISELEDIETNKENCVIRLHKVRVEKPVVTEADGSKRTITPLECRLRKKTYSAPVFVEMSLLDSGKEVDREEVYIGELPVMIRSDICHLAGQREKEAIKKGEDPNDQGGYFIISGSERVLVSVEDLAPNRMIISKEMKAGKALVVGSIFSVKGGFRAKISVERNASGYMYINFPASPKNLNLFIVLKALGFNSDRKIMEAFNQDPDTLNDVMLNLEKVTSKNTEEALDYIGKRVAAGQQEEYRKSRAEYILDNYLLPHVGTTANDRAKKAYYLAKIAERCIEVAYGRREEDDKDHYANKRIKISGNLMDELFRYALGYFIKDVKYQVERAYTRRRKIQIRTLVRPDAFTDRVRFAMATGQWMGNRQGVSQLLDRTTYLSQVSHLRRVMSPLSKTHPHFEARDLHPTHFGKLCPNETPEGQNCGLLKNLAMGCFISVKERENLEPELEKMGVEIIKKV